MCYASPFGLARETPIKTDTVAIIGATQNYLQNYNIRQFTTRIINKIEFCYENTCLQSSIIKLLMSTYITIFYITCILIRLYIMGFHICSHSL